MADFEDIITGAQGITQTIATGLESTRSSDEPYPERPAHQLDDNIEEPITTRVEPPPDQNTKPWCYVVIFVGLCMVLCGFVYLITYEDLTARTLLKRPSLYNIEKITTNTYDIKSNKVLEVEIKLEYLYSEDEIKLLRNIDKIKNNIIEVCLFTKPNFNNKKSLESFRSNIKNRINEIFGENVVSNVYITHLLYISPKS